MKPISAFLILLSACGSVDNSTPDAPATVDDGPGGGDAVGGDASAARCDLGKPFATPTLVPKVNTSNDEFWFTTTRDELSGFVSYVVQQAPSNATILATGRRTIDDPFSTPNANITDAINGVIGSEYAASPISDGLLVYFHRQSGPNIGIYAATRMTGEDFTAGTAVTVDGKQLLDALSATISADGMTLYWLDIATFVLHSATRGAKPTSFTGSTVTSKMGIGGNAVLTADELTLFYSEGNDIMETTRASTGMPFGVGVPVANVNSAQNDYPTHLSHDGCVLYLVSTRPGGLGGPDIWEARRPQ